LYLTKLFRSGAVRDIAILASGRLGATIIGLVSVPFISRLFTPSEFGVAAFFIAIATLLSQLLPMAFQNAVVVPKAEREALALVKVSVVISIVLAVVVTLFIIVMAVFNFSFAFSEQLGKWLWVLPVVSLFLALSLVCESWLTRKKKFSSSAKATFSQAVVLNGGRLTFGGLFGGSVWGLIVPYIVATALRLGLLARVAFISRGDIYKAGMPAVLSIAKEYSEFPRYNLPAGFLRGLSEKLPVLMLAPFFGAPVVGLYAMADRLIKTPVTMGAMSVRRVYLQRASVILHNNGNLKRSYLKSTLYMLILGFTLMCLLLVVGKDLLIIVLGDHWAQAGDFVQILSPLMFLILASRPAAALIDLLRQQKLWLRLQIGSTLLRICFMAIAWVFWSNVETVLWGFVLGAIPLHIWIIVHIWVYLDTKAPVSGEI